MNDEASRIYGIRSLARQIQSSLKKVYLVTSCLCRCKSLDYFFQLPWSIHVFQKCFWLLSYDFQECISTLTIEISDVPRTEEDASIPSRKASTRKTLLERTLNLQR